MQNSKLHHGSVLYDKYQNKSLGEDQVQMETLCKQCLYSRTILRTYSMGITYSTSFFRVLFFFFGWGFLDQYEMSTR